VGSIGCWVSSKTCSQKVKGLSVTSAEGVTICGERSRIAGEITVGVAVSSIISTIVSSIVSSIISTIVSSIISSIVSATSSRRYTTSYVACTRTPSN